MNVSANSLMNATGGANNNNSNPISALNNAGMVGSSQNLLASLLGGGTNTNSLVSLLQLQNQSNVSPILQLLSNSLKQ
jgi:hypothetical protein